MKRIIIGNWKMNLTAKQSEILTNRLVENTERPSADIVLCPNFVQLANINMLLKAKPGNKFKLGVHNINNHDLGAFTGEVSAPMIKGLASYAIVGHSERRVNFGETDEMISKKVSACLRNKIIPILCVGENLHERQEGLAKRTVLDQLEEDLSEITSAESAKIVIAYEPVWAIGTGKTASPYDVEDMLEGIYRYLVNKYTDPRADKISLLYGGSINAENAKSFLDLNKSGGLLVGGASLNYKAFSSICQLG